MMHLKIDQMRAFLHVADSGTLTGAARILNVTQPAISARIRNLEEMLGGTLFHRDEGQFRLNTRGSQFLRYVERIEHVIMDIERTVALPDQLAGHIRFGIAETVVHGLFLDVIHALAKDAPGISVELQVDLSAQLHRGLVTREYDLVIAIGDPFDAQVRSIPLPPVPLKWYTARRDPIWDTQAARQLFGKPVFTHPRKSAAYRQMREQVWSHVGTEVALIPSSCLYSTANLVASGHGVAALPDYLAKRFLRDKSIREFCPGWHPEPLRFSAHFLREPSDPLIQRVAQIVERTGHLFQACDADMLTPPRMGVQ